MQVFLNFERVQDSNMRERERERERREREREHDHFGAHDTLSVLSVQIYYASKSYLIKTCNY